MIIPCFRCFKEVKVSLWTHIISTILGVKSVTYACTSCVQKFKKEVDVPKEDPIAQWLDNHF